MEYYLIKRGTKKETRVNGHVSCDTWNRTRVIYHVQRLRFDRAEALFDLIRWAAGCGLHNPEHMSASGGGGTGGKLGKLEPILPSRVNSTELDDASLTSKAILPSLAEKAALSRNPKFERRQSTLSFSSSSRQLPG